MNEFILNCDQISKILPQRFPFAMIDRVVEFKKGESLVAIKNITANEWPLSACGASPVTNRQSSGHDSFVGLQESSAVFPQTLLIEAAAQAALILYHLSMVKEGETPRYILGRVKAEFFGEVEVGDIVHLKVSDGRMLKQGGYSSIRVSRSDRLLAELMIIYSVTFLRGIG